MRWSVDDIYVFCKKLIKKNQAGGLSATDLFYLWNAEQHSYFLDIVGRWQARSNGKTGQNTGLIQNETIIGELSPFIIPVTLTIASGVAYKPDDLIYRLAMRIDGVDVIKINHNQMGNVSGSAIDPPSIADNTYYFMEYEDYYKFLPTTVTEAELDYVASCTDIKWGFTYDSNGRQVYNAGTSVQPKWNTPTLVTITKRALTNMGIGFKDSDFINAGRVAQATGD